MKNNKRMAAAAICCLMALTTAAQNNNGNPKPARITVTGGPTIAVNSSNLSHSGISGGKSSMRAGCNFGGFINLGLSEHFSIQGEMLINHKASTFRWQQNKGDYRYWGMTVPIYVMYHYLLPDSRALTIGIGPYTDFGFRAHFKTANEDTDLYSRTGEKGLPLMKDSDTGFGVKIGYELSCGMQINAEYRHSVSNVIDSNSSSVKMRPQTVAIGLAYRFGK